MGSSVFHGGFSTYLCVMVLSQGKLYSIVVFFKCWTCIVGLGLINGLVLLPVLMSLLGPLPYEEEEEGSISDHNVKDEKESGKE
jgi:Niemann-Pick C1 protein